MFLEEYINTMRKLEFNYMDSKEIRYGSILKSINGNLNYVYKCMQIFHDEESLDWIENNCNLINYDDYSFFIYTCNINGKCLYFIPVCKTYGEFNEDEIFEEDFREHYVEMYQEFPKEDFRNIAVRKIQRACYKWLYSPKCKDGTVGIVPRLEYKKIKKVL